MNSSTTKVITKETVQRLLKDVKQIIKHPLTENGIYYSHDESDMMKGYALIVGPSETPYFGGFYFFKFDFPFDYPFSPPKVTYMTNDGYTRFNPNLYKCGKVCVSILNTWAGDKWSSCQTINSILLTLCSLLNDAPLLNEPGFQKIHADFKPYQEIIEYKNIDFAVCQIIKNVPKDFEFFYPMMKEAFIKNYVSLCEIVASKNKEAKILRTNIYSLTITIDYDSLEHKLIKTKQYIDTNTDINTDTDIAK